MTTPSVEPVVRSRLLPRISFRVLFILTSLGAVVFALARVAGQGAALAIGIQIAIAFAALCFVLFAVSFLIAWCFSISRRIDPEEPLQASPFASDRLPPQILPPRDRPS